MSALLGVVAALGFFSTSGLTVPAAPVLAAPVLAAPVLAAPVLAAPALKVEVLAVLVVAGAAPEVTFAGAATLLSGGLLLIWLLLLFPGRIPAIVANQPREINTRNPPNTLPKIFIEFDFRLMSFSHKNLLC